MSVPLMVREVFFLSSGMTAFACEESEASSGPFGRGATIYVDAKERQKIRQVREYSVVNINKNNNIIALEADDLICLTKEEVWSGGACIAFEN